MPPDSAARLTLRLPPASATAQRSLGAVRPRDLLPRQGRGACRFAATPELCGPQHFRGAVARFAEEKRSPAALVPPVARGRAIQGPSCRRQCPAVLALEVSLSVEGDPLGKTALSCKLQRLQGGA